MAGYDPKAGSPIFGSDFKRIHEGKHQIGFDDLDLGPAIYNKTLDPARVISGTVQVAVQFDQLARTVEVINTRSGSNVPVRVHVKPVNHHIFRSGSTDVIIQSGTREVISGGCYIPLNEYGSSYMIKAPVGAIFISLANTSATGSVCIVAGLAPVASGAAPFFTGSGFTSGTLT